jgi:tetratricopeptide (TPR) repeat protein
MYAVRRLLFIAIGLVCLLSGCSYYQQVGTGQIPSADIELTGTPFFPQEEYQCGPAALATLLASSDIEILPATLSTELYIPKRQGTLQLEIIDSIRRHNRIPYQIRPEMDAITAELKAGRTVLVLQNLGLKILPTYHYAVIIGVLRDGSVVLRSGLAERLLMDRDDFMSTWAKAGKWGVIALKSDELPADNDINRYLEAVSRVEATGNIQLAEQCYQTVLYWHPQSELALFGLANTKYAKHQYTSAATLYSSLLKQNPDHAEAANNLAESLASLHCYQKAIDRLDTFLQQSNVQSVPAFMLKTREEIRARLEAEGGISADCSETILEPTR